MARTNEEFRSLLSKTEETSNKIPKLTKEQVAAKQRQKDKALKWKAIQDKKKLLQEEQEELDASYVDRAKLRREQEKTGVDGLEDIKELDAEQTKFLGGAVTTTHFVKGLDYALLERTRQEMNQSNEEEEEVTVEDLEAELNSVRASAKVKLPAGEVSRDDNVLVGDEIKTSTAFGKSIYRSVVLPLLEIQKSIYENRPNSKYYKTATSDSYIFGAGLQIFPEARDIVPSDKFLPHRCAFEFDLSASETAFPTTLLRSKADTPETSKLTGNISQALFDRIARVFNKTLKVLPVTDEIRVAKKPQTITMKPVPAKKKADSDSDDDIFSGVGKKYECKPSAVRREVVMQTLKVEQPPKPEPIVEIVEADIDEVVQEVPKKQESHVRKIESRRNVVNRDIDPAMARLFAREDAKRLELEERDRIERRKLIEKGDTEFLLEAMPKQNKLDDEYTRILPGAAPMLDEEDEEEPTDEKKKNMSDLQKQNDQKFNKNFQQVSQLLKKRKEDKQGGKGDEKKLKY